MSAVEKGLSVTQSDSKNEVKVLTKTTKLRPVSSKGVSQQLLSTDRNNKSLLKSNDITENNTEVKKRVVKKKKKVVFTASVSQTRYNLGDSKILLVRQERTRTLMRSGTNCIWTCIKTLSLDRHF